MILTVILNVSVLWVGNIQAVVMLVCVTLALIRLKIG